MKNLWKVLSIGLCLVIGKIDAATTSYKFLVKSQDTQNTPFCFVEDIQFYDRRFETTWECPKCGRCNEIEDVYCVACGDHNEELEAELDDPWQFHPIQKKRGNPPP